MNTAPKHKRPENDLAQNKIVGSLDELLTLVAQWRTQHLEVGFTCGAFDILHAGHADYLERARALCDRLIVGVNSDVSIRTYKNPLRPIIIQDHRMKLVGALQAVDAVIIMNETRPATLISAIVPDLYVKGGDYQKSQLESAPLVESYGGRCEVIPVEYDISSSKIIDRIRELSLYDDPQQAVNPSGPVVFLDRDGTLIEDLHFLKDPSRVKLLDGVGTGLRLLQDNGFRLAMVTNQQGLGMGYFDYDDFVATNSSLFGQLSSFGVRISKVFFCPHSLADQCACRKPGSELIRKGIEDFAVSPDNCFLIGDAETDMVAAQGAGCEGILISGNENPPSKLTVRNFSEAVQLVLQLRDERALLTT